MLTSIDVVTANSSFSSVLFLGTLTRSSNEFPHYKGFRGDFHLWFEWCHFVFSSRQRKYSLCYQASAETAGWSSPMTDELLVGFHAHGECQLGWCDRVAHSALMWSQAQSANVEHGSPGRLYTFREILKEVPVDSLDVPFFSIFPPLSTYWSYDTEMTAFCSLNVYHLPLNFLFKY